MQTYYWRHLIMKHGRPSSLKGPIQERTLSQIPSLNWIPDSPFQNHRGLPVSFVLEASTGILFFDRQYSGIDVHNKTVLTYPSRFGSLFDFKLAEKRGGFKN